MVDLPMEDVLDGVYLLAIFGLSWHMRFGGK